MFGMQDCISSSSIAPDAPLVHCMTLAHARMFLWSSSAQFSLSAWPLTIACRGEVFPCCTNGLPPVQTSMSAQQKMFLDVCPWFHATWKAAQSIHSHTATGLEFQWKLLLIQDSTAGLGAGLLRLRSVYGCTGRRFPANSQKRQIQESRARECQELLLPCIADVRQPHSGLIMQTALKCIFITQYSSRYHTQYRNR